MHQVRAIGPFQYHQPDSLESTIQLLQEHGSEAALLAGGTALLIDMRYGELAPRHLVDLWGVPRISSVNANGDLRIGAMTTVTDLVRATADRTELAGLREAGLSLGSRQIQNMCTVGGNICKASPGADLVPPLLCADAEVALSGPEGARTAPLDGFLVGPDRTDLKPAEVLTEIRLPQLPARTGSAFEKVMRRQAVDCSIVSVAARITFEEDGVTCAAVRIGIAAAAPNPFRARAAEKALQGEIFSEELAQEAGKAARQESSPIDDVRASAEYRRLLVEELTARALVKAARRAQPA